MRFYEIAGQYQICVFLLHNNSILVDVVIYARQGCRNTIEIIYRYVTTVRIIRSCKAYYYGIRMNTLSLTAQV